MEKITEKAVKDRVKKIISVFQKHYPIYTFCPMTFGYGESGHPDRVLIARGQFIGLEVKKDANNHHSRPELKPRPNEAAQKIQAERIRAAGGRWMCIHSGNLTDLVRLLYEVLEILPGTIPDGDRDKLRKLLSW